MKFFYLIFTLFSITSSYSQKFIDMTNELSDVKGYLVIDGNALRIKHNTNEEIIITGKNLKFQHKSGIILNNVIVQLSGDILVEEGAKVYPKILDSYIFCKNSESIKSDRIIRGVGDRRIVELSQVKYLKKIKGNPKIYIYSSLSGKCKFKGYKNDIEGQFLNISRYDIKVEGLKKSFTSKILFY